MTGPDFLFSSFFLRVRKTSIFYISGKLGGVLLLNGTVESESLYSDYYKKIQNGNVIRVNDRRRGFANEIIAGEYGIGIESKGTIKVRASI